MAPVAAYARMHENQLQLDAVVLNADGTKRLEVRVKDEKERAEVVGLRAAEFLLSKGADKLIAESRTGNDD